MTETLEAQVGALLRQREQTVGTAESCTGGLIMHRLTNIPGSSAYVLGGIVAYSNAVKQALLNVTSGTLIAHGAVSEQTAQQMALGARAVLKCDFALSVTGIAGPGGGTDEKPVGLTYIAIAGPDDLLGCQRNIWEGNREAIKQASADAALQLLLDTLTR